MVLIGNGRFGWGWRAWEDEERQHSLITNKTCLGPC